MKLLSKAITTMTILMSLLLLTGCIDLETSDSQTSQSKVSTNTVTTEEATEVKKDIPNDPEPVYGDPELKITYKRPSGSPPIRIGDNGDDVGWLQEALNKAMNANISVDCSFGNGTESKVLSFQSRCGLDADGVVGPMTISTLVEIVSGNRTMPAEIIQIATDPPARSYNEEPVQRSFDTPAPAQSFDGNYVVNTNTGKFHSPSCSQVHKMNDENKWEYYGSRDDLINQGYSPCGKCNP